MQRCLAPDHGLVDIASRHPNVLLRYFFGMALLGRRACFHAMTSVGLSLDLFTALMLKAKPDIIASY